MTIQLSAQSEIIIPYKHFGEGRVVDLMPQLTEAGYNPAGIAVLVDRRQNAPEEVRAILTPTSGPETAQVLIKKAVHCLP